MKIKIHTNTDHTATGYMLYVIPHILKVVFENPNKSYSNHVKNFTKKLLFDLSDNKTNDAIYIFG